MKFICQKQELTKALTIVTKAVTNRSTIPVLKGIMLEAAPSGQLTISASDLDLSIQDTIAVDTVEPGAVIVMARLFADIVKQLPGTEIQFDANEDNKVTIRSMNSKFDIIGMSTDEFPVVNQVDDDTESIRFDKKTFREMVEKTSFAASTDESRGIITGILLELSPNQMTMVAIDGYRMAINRRNTPDSGQHEFVIAAGILNEVSKILAVTEEDDDQGVLYLGKKRAIFRFGTVQAELKLLDGKFIAYRDILPKKSGITMMADRSLLMACIERASLLAKAGKNNLVKFELQDTVLTISSDSEEGSVREELAVTKEGPDLTIGFNAQYLQHVLKAIDDTEVKLLFNSPIDPCLVEPLTGSAYEYLVLPVRI